MKATDSADKGDQYVFIGLGSFNKAIISYRVGKRNQANTEAFVADLRERVVGNPQINSDAWPAYESAVTNEFGEPRPEAARRYSPGVVGAVAKRAVAGAPREDTICRSYVERGNLNEAAVGLFLASIISAVFIDHFA